MERRTLRWMLAGLFMMATGVAVGATHGGGGASHSISHSTRTQSPPAVTAAPQRTNPLLPVAIAVDGFFPEMSLVQKLPTMTPSGFAPLYSVEDWETFRKRFGAEADELPRKRSSGQIEFAQKLIAAAEADELPRAAATQAGTMGSATTQAATQAAATQMAETRPATVEVSAGLKRLLLLRAAAICYRSSGGFPTADRAVRAYEKLMDLHSPAQVGALWTVANQMSRMAVTPKPERIRYSGIAARANMQLAILMLESDQVEAADKVIRMVGYHEGWLKSDATIRAKIAAVRNVVKQTIVMMDYLGTQYRPAISGDDGALMALYLYGRFVKNDPWVVADFPSRKPSSAMAQLAGQLSAADRDPAANFPAAESLRVVAGTLPDGVLKQRTMYAALERYRKFIKAPETEHERVKRTLALMAIEAAVADGARPGVTVKPFEVTPPSTQPVRPTVHAEAVARG